MSSFQSSVLVAIPSSSPTTVDLHLFKLLHLLELQPRNRPCRTEYNRASVLLLFAFLFSRCLKERHLLMLKDHPPLNVVVCLVEGTEPDMPSHTNLDIFDSAEKKFPLAEAVIFTTS